MKTFYSKSAHDTTAFARKFARTLSPGDVILLDGDLGAGKTVFTKGVVYELSNDLVEATSPTFVTLNIYNTTPKIFHFDLYRLNSSTELDAIGAEEYLFSDGISIVEWPSRAGDYYFGQAIKIFIKKINDNEREIQIER